MKLSLLFLIISQTLIAQRSYLVPSTQSQQEIKTLLLGDWHLYKSEIIDEYINFDQNKTLDIEAKKRNITFTSDSIFSNIDSTFRFYFPIQNYAYKIEYDSLMKQSSIQLYTGKKRKLHKVESYDLLKCSSYELIIRSNKHIWNGIDNASFSIIYRYKRELPSLEYINFSADLQKGKWYYSSNLKTSSFLSEENKDIFEFSNTNKNPNYQDSNYFIELDFKRNEYDDYLSISSYSKFDGSWGSINYTIDINKKLLYLYYKKPLVYNIELLNAEKLILSLNKEETEKLNRE
jgi:hypothetical protein